MATAPSLRVRISADLDDIRQGLSLLRGELATVKRQAEKSLPDTSRWSKGLAQVRSQLAGFAAAYASLNTVGAYLRMADEAANLSGRLRLATKSQMEFNRAHEQTYAIAQETSAEWGSIVGLYAQLSQSTGRSQEEVLALTKTISQSFAVSGGGAEAAASGIRQLQQALAGGVLRAEEFETINNTNARLVRAIGEQLGVHASQVRAYVNEGKVSSDILLKAIQNSAKAIDGESKKLPLTFGSAMKQVRNALLGLVGDTEKATGGSKDLAEALKGLARTLESEDTKRGFATLVSELVSLTKFAAVASTGFVKFADDVREAMRAAEEWASNTTWNSGAAKSLGLENGRGLFGIGDYLREQFPWLYKAAPGTSSLPDFSNVTSLKPDFSNVTGTPIPATRPPAKPPTTDPTNKDPKAQRNALAEAVAAYNARLREAIVLHGQETQLAKLNYEIQHGALKGIAEDQAEALRAQARTQDWLDEGWLEAAGYRIQVGAEAAKTALGEMSEFALQASRNIQDALGESMHTVLTGRFSDIADSWRNALQRMAAELAASSFLKLLGQIGKGNSGTWWGKLLSEVAVDARKHHSGGVIGLSGVRSSMSPLLLGQAPRYHTGGLLGLAPDERAIIGKVGEEVLTRNDPRHRLNGGLAGGDVKLQVNIQNESGQPMQETGRTWDGQQLVVDMVLGAVASDIANGGRVAAAGTAAYGWRRTGRR